MIENETYETLYSIVPNAKDITFFSLKHHFKRLSINTLSQSHLPKYTAGTC